MGTVLVNGTPVEIDANERLNVIQVADRAGVEVPRYCWHPALTVVASWALVGDAVVVANYRLRAWTRPYANL